MLVVEQGWSKGQRMVCGFIIPWITEVRNPMRQRFWEISGTGSPTTRRLMRWKKDCRIFSVKPVAKDHDVFRWKNIYGMGMMENKVSQISIEGRQTGVIGLKFAIRSIVEWARGKDDSDITAELLTRLEKRNYVPSSIEEAYRKALLREYKRYLGQDVEEEAVAGLQVVILWPGCAQCSSLESRLQHVTDAKEIGRYGVMGTPALIINRKVVAVGSVPGKKKIRLAFGCRCKNGEI